MSMTATRWSHATSLPQTAATVVEGLYRAHGLGLVRFALLLTGDQATAEDSVQEALLGLYLGLQGGRRPDDVLAYLRTAVLNAARTALRRRARQQALARAAQPDLPVWSAEAAVLADEDGRAVLAAVALLPQRQREVLALRYFLELSEKEIAAMLGVTRGTVASTTARGLASLARMLKEER
ncbi:MAG TPA: sigma-70 family RNA polymerase sigma factor [Streptosporangiaceae bacterium]